MVQINWTILAQNDLKDIFDYISKDSTKYAKLQIIRAIQRTQILKSQIYIGKSVSEIEQNEIREIIERNYRIIYKIVTEN